MIETSVNGLGPYRFVLDTGSTHSAIDPDVARRSGAPLVARTTVTSVMGSDQREVVRLDRLSIGPVSALDVRPSALTSSAKALIGGLDGVIGQDVLGSLHYAIDFRLRHITWNPQMRGTAAVTISLEPSEDRFVVTLPQVKSSLRLVPDSGADRLLLYRHPDRPLPPLSVQPRMVELFTLSTTGIVWPALVYELRVGSRTLRDIDAVVAIPEAPRSVDGLLPLHLFERVTFDGPRRLLTLEPPA